MKNLSRRRFLETGAVGIAAVHLTSPILENVVTEKNIKKKDTRPLGSDELRLLTLVMDEIIPKSDNMPAASEAGCEKYLTELAARDLTVTEQLQETLYKLNATSHSVRRRFFSDLAPELRVRVLKEFEQRDSDAMIILRNYIYEAYYMQPRVRELIGYESHPTNETGPKLTFDEALLSNIRNKPKHYREV